MIHHCLDDPIKLLLIGNFSGEKQQMILAIVEGGLLAAYRVNPEGNDIWEVYAG